MKSFTRPRLGQVFVSAHHLEYAAAENLEKALLDEGYTVWWAQKIKNGTDWHGNIDEALQSCNCVVVLWSKKSADSAWVCHEASQAIARDIYVPVLLEEDVQLQEPYKRGQATFVGGLLSSSSASGVQNVVERVKILLPSLAQRSLLTTWAARWALVSVTLAIAVGVAFWQLFAGVRQQLASLDRLQLGTAATSERQTKELSEISSSLEKSNAVVAEVIDQVREILRSELRFAYVMGIDSKNAGYLRVENQGSGIASIKRVLISHKQRPMTEASLLLELEALGIVPYSLSEGQKISPGRGVALFGIPAKHISGARQRCISDKARKEFFEELRVTIEYASPSAKEELPLVWDYQSSNTVPCVR